MRALPVPRKVELRSLLGDALMELVYNGPLESRTYDKLIEGIDAALRDDELELAGHWLDTILELYPGMASAAEGLLWLLADLKAGIEELQMVTTEVHSDTRGVE